MPSWNQLLTLLLLAGSTGSALALEVRIGATANQAIFGIDFPKETRSFYSHADRVQSISIQDYLTANFRVAELNIVTQGSALLRIYHSRPLRPGELQRALSHGPEAAAAPGSTSIIQRPLPPKVQALADRSISTAEAITGTEVLKEYPTATHAHTIEYRIATLSELLSLHEALTSHWLGRALDEEAGEPLSLGGTLFIVQGQ